MTKSKNTRKATATRKAATPANKTNKTNVAKATESHDSSKLSAVIALLRRKEGATIEQLMKATGWQSHSVRGAMSGALKKNRGLAISSAKVDGIRIYRIAA